MDANAQAAAYQRLFCGDGAAERLRGLAVGGGLRAAGLRSIVWKVFLGVLPGVEPDGWAAALAASRAAYDAHKEAILVDPYKDGGDKDLLTNNPLAQAEDSSWKKYFELQELQKDIQIDLERLNFDDPLFAEDGPHFERVQGMMLRILTVWASLNPAIAYRQGMHELLAPLLAVLERDCQQGGTDAADSETRLLGCVTDRMYTEHDGYALFEQLMAVISESFAPQERKKGSDGQYARPGGVVARCDRMQNTLLRSKDYELYIHLQSQHIEPQLYSMKWIRLLLGREFHLEDVLLLWDAMFADHHETCGKGTKTLPGGRGLELLEYVCIAMLIYIRADLLGKDNMGCLQRLMKYPPVEDVKVFVKSALEMRDSTNSPSAPEARPPQPPRPTAPPPQTAPAPPHPPPAAMQRSEDSASGPNGWLLSGSSSPASASAGVAGTGGAGGLPRGGGQVAFVGGQIVHVGAGAPLPSAAPRARSAQPAASAGLASGGGGGDGGGGGGGDVRATRREMMNGALSVKMNAPLATLEKMLPPVGDPRRAEMQQAIDTLRQVQQALGQQHNPVAPLPSASHQQAMEQGAAGASGFPFFHISNSETAQRDSAARLPPAPKADGGGGMPQGAAAKMNSAAGVGEGAEEAGAGVGGAVKGGVTVEIPKVGVAVAGGTKVEKAPELTQEEKDKLEEERKKAEQVKARRAAALSLLLEPPSPGTFTPLSNDSAKNSGILGTGDEGDGLGGLVKKKASTSVSKGLFGDDDGDATSWLK